MKTEKGEKNNLPFVITFSVCLFLSAFLSFLLVKDIYQSHKLNEEIRKFEEENRKLGRKNEIRNKEISSFNFRNYGEKFAKEKLGKKMPGEKTFVVSIKDNGNVNNKKNKNEDVKIKKDSNLPNPQKWWIYFFGPVRN